MFLWYYITFVFPCQQVVFLLISIFEKKFRPETIFFKKGIDKLFICGII